MMTPPTDSLEAALRAVPCRCGLPWDSLCHDDPLCISYHVFSADASALAAAVREGMSFREKPVLVTVVRYDGVNIYLIYRTPDGDSV